VIIKATHVVSGNLLLMLAIFVIFVLCIALVIMYKKHAAAERELVNTRLALDSHLFETMRHDIDRAEAALQSVRCAHAALMRGHMSG